MTRTLTAYVDDAARALRQARTYLTDELARIDAALAALHLEGHPTEVTIEADAEPATKALTGAATAVKRRRKASTSKTYPCPECNFVAKSPGGLGGHMNRHRPKPAPPVPVQPEDHDGHTIDIGPVTVLEDGQAAGHRCGHCGETFQWRHDLARHRLTLGHNTDEGDDQ